MSESAVAVSEQARRSSVVAGPARRWWILALVGLAQLMVVLDTPIVNIALPSAQRSLVFSDVLGLGRDHGRVRGAVRAGFSRPAPWPWLPARRLRPPRERRGEERP